MIYRLSAKALKDQEQLYRYSFSQFGMIQAARYMEELIRVFELLAEFPNLGTNCENIRADLRKHTHESHTIYYRIKADNIFIVRILHNQMDHRRYM